LCLILIPLCFIEKEIDALKLFYDLDPELNLPGMEFFSMILPLDAKATFKPRSMKPLRKLEFLLLN